jgi:hypothetical protein
LVWLHPDRMQEDETWALSVDENFEKFTSEKAQEIANFLLAQLQAIRSLPEPRQTTLLNLIIGLRNRIQSFPYDLIEQLLVGIVNAMIVVAPNIAPLTLETFDNIIDPLSDYEKRKVLTNSNHLMFSNTIAHTTILFQGALCCIE